MKVMSGWIDMFAVLNKMTLAAAKSSGKLPRQTKPIRAFRKRYVTIYSRDFLSPRMNYVSEALTGRGFEAHTCGLRLVCSPSTTHLPNALPLSQPVKMSTKAAESGAHGNTTKKFGNGQRSVPSAAARAPKYYPAEDVRQAKQVRAFSD